MNVLYLVRTWPYRHGDFFFREIAWMQQHGHTPSVVALESLPPEFVGRDVLRSYGLDDIPELLFEDDPDPLDRILAFARCHGAELIDAHDGRGPAELALEIQRRSGIPFTVRFHGGDVHSSPSPQLTDIVGAARALCPISRFLADVLTGRRQSCRNPCGVPVSIDRDRLRVCPHGMPSDCIAGEPAAQGEEIVIGTISRLTDYEKCGPFDLIEAFARIAGDDSQVTLQFIGGGELQPELESFARARGVGDRVAITGIVSWRRAVRLASGLAIFVHGSEIEGFCLPVLEGAACGLPLAVTRTGVSEEIVEDGVNGYLYDYGDAGTLADRLRRLLQGGAESRTRMGRASLARVRERFVFESTMARMESILVAAAEGAPLPP